jgi:ABC-type Mn2+/Zn2+ transport system permease subunit
MRHHDGRLRLSEALQMLTQDFVLDALKAALIVAVMCSFLGVFVVLKRIVFVGAALAEVSAFGAALAFSPLALTVIEPVTNGIPFLAGENYQHTVPLTLAFVCMLIAVVFFSQQSLGRQLPREAVIGAVYVGAVGLTILMLSKNASGSEHAQDALKGNILGVMAADIWQVGIAGGIVALIQALFHKEFVLVAFDPEVARTLGYKSSGWELLWYLTLGIMIAVSIHVAGTVLVFAYLVLPASTALLLSRRLGVVFTLAVTVAVLCTLLGTLISVSPADLPTSPTIVGCLVGSLLLAAAGRALLGLLLGRRAAQAAAN